ncbi:immunoglobulin superfamily member 1 isoform X2 [Gallus gallus]|uniref:immunoglobulin superfamily member 1 isoform X2 n=1 Tax=Gallus gallus TaxID=9031 RepID=UPI001F0204A3|nr:immunoglobulin superfamily member 1 isoform X2 [Gallus gallus]
MLLPHGTNAGGPHSRQGLSPGDTVTLRCHLPQTTAWVRLYRYENPTYIEQKDKVQRMAEFSLAGIKQFDAVRYRCQYQGLEPSGTSQKSDPVKLVVTDHRYPPPGISLSPKEHVKMGTNISIQCWNKKHGASFLLHKGGHSAPVAGGSEQGTAIAPTLPVTPSQGVPLGDNVTLRCHLPRLAAWVWLYQEGGWSYKKRKEKEQDTTEFFFASTLWEHAGRYRCQYRVSESAEVSVGSDPVELVLTGEDTGDSKWLWLLPTGPCPTAVPFLMQMSIYPPSSISLHPEQHVGTGTNVTIRCWNKDYGATFFLHKDGSSDPLQRQDFSEGDTATFTLFGVTPADSGTYRCSYHPKNYSFLSSPLGDGVTLEVTPTPARPGAELVSRGNLVVAVVRGCAAVLIFALGVFFVIDARSLWIRRDESLGGKGIEWH